MSSSNQTSLPLQGQTALVTGASGGIGQAISLALAAAGCDVVVHGYHHHDALKSLASKIEALGGQVLTYRADLSDQVSLHSLASDAWQWQGKLDLLVNNAGADVLTGQAAQWSFDQKLQQLWQVDVRGCVTLSRLIGPRMKERGQGSIINIGWDQAERGMAGDSGELFATIKGAVMAFTRSLAQSLAPQVRVNCLALGWIRTAWGEGASEYWQERVKKESLRQRWGTPDDVAAAVRFLASADADFITGQVIEVNGGFRFGSP
jgi:3-oxoacyl-[acyl-carrier protein] reductase